jgi:adenine-specific DNA-methyltransferase
LSNLLTALTETLVSDDRLVSEGKLMKNKIIELSLHLDSSLLNLLLKSEEVKQHFFTTVGEVIVFDKVKFQKFVNNKSFLPDSFTSFKNKIGLAVEDSYLSESREVVLAWPYKDCILEGGQSKDDAKRNEIFWNQTLAPNEVDRLLSPKTLQNFTRYTAYGAAKATHVGTTDNLIIKGNNLLALCTLRKVFRGRVKLIYIDPPYNTGTDSFKYNDSFNHSTWLTFMRNRLEVARDLLMSSGVLFIHVGDVEMHYLKVLADEVFGRENFIATIPRKTRSGKDDVPYKMSQDFDWMLAYTNGAASTEKLFKRSVSRRYFKSDDFPNDEWRLSDLTKQTSTEDRKNSDFTLVNPRNGDEYPVNPNRSWSVTVDTVQGYLDKKKIIFPGDYPFLDLQGPAMRTFKSEEIERKGEDFDKSYVSSDFMNLVMDDLLKKFTNSKGTEEITNLFGSKAFAYPKNEALLARIIECTTQPGDLVLDFHLGSGTTAAVAHKLSRQYIGIEQMDYVEDISVQRLKKVIDGEQGGISEAAKWSGGGEFVYCELASLNQQYVDKILLSETSKDLKALWSELRELAHLSYKVVPKNADKKNLNFDLLDVNDQKRFLIEVLDKNLLYVPLTEIKDASFGINADDIKLNREFFKLA